MLRILSFSFSSLSTAFSADISSCFMFYPTICSSSSIPLRFFSASSALSIALRSSSSWTPNFLFNSSSFCSLSLAIFVVCLRFLSSSSRVTSLFMHLLVVRRHLCCLSQVLVQLLKGDLVVHALALHNLHLLQNIIGLLGGDSELGDGVGQGGLGLFGLLLHEHDPPGERGNVGLHLAVHLVLLLVGSLGLVQFVRGLIKLDLEAVDLLAVIPDVAVCLVGHPVGLLGGLVELVDDGVELVSLVLQGLHLLPDGVHAGGGRSLVACAVRPREL